MALLRQYVNGVRIHSLSVQASADDLNALKSLMLGKVEEWETKATGGTATQMPDKLNRRKYRIGRIEGLNGRESCVINIHHLDPAKSDDDVKNLVIGKFNASWNVDKNAEYCELVYHRG